MVAMFRDEDTVSLILWPWQNLTNLVNGFKVAVEKNVPAVNIID